MFFLVPYKLIDREDLSIIQKMCILYLARHYDEKGALDPINELELAEKLRISTSEVRLNLDVLFSKGIINIDNHLVNPNNEDKDAKNIIVKEAVFKNLSSDSFEELKMKLNNQIKREKAVISTEASVSERSGEISLNQAEPEPTMSSRADNTVISSGAIAESRDLAKAQDDSYIADLANEDIFKEEIPANPEYDEVLAKINSAEEKIKERAAKLKINVRKRDNNRRNNSDTKTKYNRRKTDRLAAENKATDVKEAKPNEAKKPSETDELLKILAESNQTLLKQKKSIIDENFEKFQNRPNRRKTDVQNKRKNINPKFVKASSVYKKHDSKQIVKDEDEKEDIEV